MEAARIKEGTMIFAASPSDDGTIAAAKAYIEKNKLTAEDVKLGRIGNSVVVVAQREIKLLF